MVTNRNPGTSRTADRADALRDWVECNDSAIEKLAVIPIRDAVFFPGMNFSLLLGRDRSIRALETTMDDGGRRLVLVTQRRLDEEDPQFDAIHRVGVLVEVTSTGRLPDGMMRMNVESSGRVEIEQWCDRDPCLRAVVRPLTPASDPMGDSEIEALARTVSSLFEELIGEGRNIPPEALTSVQSCRSPDAIADLVLSYLALPIDRKQRMLEETDTRNRLQNLVSILYEEMRILEIQRDIRQRVERDAGEDQRTFLLREQLKAIQEELGERDADSLDLLELRRRVQESGMPEAAATVARRELDRLARMGVGSPEATVVRNYVECVLDVPWKQRSECRIDLTAAERILSEGHHGLQDAKERILDFIAVRMLAGTDLRAPVLCFEGP
ncbi:MAG: LON peptidase substrate-binding domain-containing protein, partial [Armatimonadaceae bacterium]